MAQHKQIVNIFKMNCAIIITTLVVYYSQKFRAFDVPLPNVLRLFFK